MRDDATCVRVTGTVKIVNVKLHYYIIRQDTLGAPDVFCHEAMLPPEIPKLLIEQRVSFTTRHHPKGLRAVDLETF